MADVGQLTVVLNAEDNLSGALRQAEGQLQDTHKAMLAVGGAMTAVGVAGVAAFKGAVDAAASFESAMSGIQAVMGADTWAQFGGQLDALAMQLGKDTVFSAKEAAQAIEELSKAGVSATNILGGAAEAVTSLAAAGGVTIKDAAEIASNAMNVFSIAGTDMAHTADIISGAVNASSLEMNDFKFALQMVGAVAKSASQSFDETATAIAVMGQAGIKGSDAGTSLKTMLVNLVPASGPAEAAMRRLGIITEDGANQFFTATGAAKSFTEIAQILQDALSGLSDKDRVEAMHKAFGTDAMRAASVLSTAGAAGMRDMAAAMGEVTAQGVAATKLDNYAGAMKNLGGSVETLAIVVGKQLTPALWALADGVKGLVDGFMSLPKEVQASAIVLAGIVTVVTLVTGAVIAANGALALLGVTLGGLAAVALPVTAVVVGITVAVAALVLAWQNDWLGIQTTTLAVLGEILPRLEALSDWYHDRLAVELDYVHGRWNAFWDAVGPTITAAWAIVGPILGHLAEGFGTLLSGALGIAGAALSAWVDNFRTGIAALAAVLGPVAAVIGGKAAEINQALQDGLKAMAPEAQAATSAAGDAIEAEVQATGVEVRALSAEVGHEMAAGLIRGLDEVTPASVAAVRANMRTLLGAAKAEAEIGSPSQLFAEEVGLPISEGILAGMMEGARAVEAAMEQQIAAWAHYLGPTARGGAAEYFAKQDQRLGNAPLTMPEAIAARQRLAAPEGGAPGATADVRAYTAAVQDAGAATQQTASSVKMLTDAETIMGAGFAGVVAQYTAGTGLATHAAYAWGASQVEVQQKAALAEQTYKLAAYNATLLQNTELYKGNIAALQAYTAASLVANSLNTRVLTNLTQSSGMQAGLTGAQTYGNVGDANYLAWLNAWQNGWNTPTGQVGTGSGSGGGTPYYPPVTVHIQAPPALITPTSDLELRATADRLAPLVADALQRSGRLGMG